jgi:hypothetical protein
LRVSGEGMAISTSSIRTGVCFTSFAMILERAVIASPRRGCGNPHFVNFYGRLLHCVRIYSLCEVLIKQILPFWIHTFDEIDLFLPRTCLNLFFAGDGCVNIISHFKKYKLVDIVFGREFATFPRFMFQNSPLQIIGHPCV